MLIAKARAKSEKPLLLVFPFGLMSHYLRCLILSRELKKYFTIKFLDNPAYRDFIRQENFDTFTCSYLDPSKAIDGVRRFDFSWLEKEELGRLFNNQVNVIERLEPALVLGDFSPTLKMAAAATGVKFVSLLNGYMSRYYAGTRDISKTHPAQKFIRLLPGSIGAKLTRIGEGLAFQKLHLPFRELRQTYNLTGTSSYLEELEGDLTLVCDLPILFPQNVLPSNYHVIGPVYYDAGNSTHHTNLTCDSTKKTILVSMGSSGSWENVAFLKHPFYNRYNVIAVGDSETRLEASHIRHLPFAGMHEIFPNIDLLICHGGNGTLYQALYYNVPILVSTNHCEQEWNLSAFERLGLATRLDHTQEASTLQHVVAACIEQQANSHRARLSAEVRNWQKNMPGILQKIVAGMTTRLVRTG